jgi:hypothetical protein
MSFSTATCTLTSKQFVLGAAILLRNSVCTQKQFDNVIEAANDPLTESHNVEMHFQSNVIRFAAIEFSKNYQESRFTSHIENNLPEGEVSAMLEDCKTVHTFLKNIINVEDALDCENLSFSNLLHHAKINLGGKGE